MTVIMIASFCVLLAVLWWCMTDCGLLALCVYLLAFLFGGFGVVYVTSCWWL